MRFFSSVSALLLLTTTLSTAAYASSGTSEMPAAGEPAVRLEEGGALSPQERAKTQITILGRTHGSRVNPAPASVYKAGQTTLDRAPAADIHRVLREAPGVNIQEEDGFGLRPNIGFRGGRVDRSSDITLMEDGVLIAPAPYAASSAYYFPHMDRMSGVEVRKGASSIAYGPRTTNGVLNLLTRDIPEGAFSGSADLGLGSFDSYKARIGAGGRQENVGYFLNLSHNQSDGFKDIDGVGGDSGYSVQDVMGKFSIHTSPGASMYQQFDVKLGLNLEKSHETYLGLTADDFAVDPFRRYAASQKDLMDADHNEIHLRHYLEFSPQTNLSTTVYRNDFRRNWYKLQSVISGGSKKSLGSVLDDPTTHAGHVAILKGAASAADALTIRANNREYLTYGVQSAISHGFQALGAQHRLEAGVRAHYDEEDRFQHEDGYRMDGSGVMVRTSTGAPGSQSNRIGSAEAWSGYVQDEVRVGDWTFIPGVRYEYIRLKTEDFGKSDPTRSGASLTTHTQTIREVIPGFAASYQVTPEWMVFGSVHKGFAPPAPPTSASKAAGVDAEESVNYELGARFRHANWSGEAIGFFNDYSNLLGRDTASSGGGGTGDEFNGGEVEAYGLESWLQYNAAQALGLGERMRLPVKAGYTYTDATFRNSFSSSFSEWGDVDAGDELPYIAPHQVSLSAGLGADDWQFDVTGRYRSEMRSVAGQGSIPDSETIDAHVVVDAYGEYRVHDNARVYVSADNLLDEVYIASRRPAGLRPGKPQAFFVGLKLDW